MLLDATTMLTKNVSQVRLNGVSAAAVFLKLYFVNPVSLFT